MKIDKKLFIFFLSAGLISSWSLLENTELIDKFLDGVNEKNIEEKIALMYPRLKKSCQENTANLILAINGNIRTSIIQRQYLSKLYPQYKEDLTKIVDSQFEEIKNAKPFKLKDNNVKIDLKNFEEIKESIKEAKKETSQGEIELSELSELNALHVLITEQLQKINEQVSSPGCKIRKPIFGKLRSRTRYPTTDEMWNMLGLENYLKDTIFDTFGKTVVVMLVVLIVIMLLLYAFGLLLIAIFSWIVSHLVTTAIITIAISLGTYFWNLKKDHK